MSLTRNRIGFVDSASTLSVGGVIPHEGNDIALFTSSDGVVVSLRGPLGSTVIDHITIPSACAASSFESNVYVLKAQGESSFDVIKVSVLPQGIEQVDVFLTGLVVPAPKGKSKNIVVGFYVYESFPFKALIIMKDKCLRILGVDAEEIQEVKLNNTISSAFDASTQRCVILTSSSLIEFAYNVVRETPVQAVRGSVICSRRNEFEVTFFSNQDVFVSTLQSDEPIRWTSFPVPTGLKVVDVVPISPLAQTQQVVVASSTTLQHFTLRFSGVVLGTLHSVPVITGLIRAADRLIVTTKAGNKIGLDEISVATNAPQSRSTLGTLLAQKPRLQQTTTSELETKLREAYVQTLNDLKSQSNPATLALCLDELTRCVSACIKANHTPEILNKVRTLISALQRELEHVSTFSHELSTIGDARRTARRTIDCCDFTPAPLRPVLK